MLGLLEEDTKMGVGAPRPTDLETQKKEIFNLLKKPLEKDDIWYLIDNKWFKQWKKYVGYDTWDRDPGIGEETTHPGPIDNAPLLKDGKCGDIKDHLIDELDYALLPEKAWHKMVSWYGTTPGQGALPRRVIESGVIVKSYTVEVYQMELKLCQNTSLDNFIVKRFSKADTIDRIEREMRDLFNVAPDKETRLWNRFSSNTFEPLRDRKCTVQDAGLFQGQVILIEEQNNDGTWPMQKRSSKVAGREAESKSNSLPGYATSSRSYSASGGNYSNYSCSGSYEPQGGGIAVTPGLCGLANLGNTCFMNAAIQCMSNTPPLTQYFIEDRYLQELNNSNPLGMQGEIAKSYGDLIKVMWSGTCSSVIPRPFKKAVGRFAPQFSGFQQQDCQELMSFLLDGLHEDLNRVIKKPYIEQKETHGRADEVVAREAWTTYLMRNNSIIVDIFHGLLKSTLVCPDCQKLSVTFDPFCYLSLPLPFKEMPFELVLVMADPFKKPLKMKVSVTKTSTVQDICTAISRLVNVAADRLVVAEVHSHRFLRILQNCDQVETLDRMDIFVYEAPYSLSEDCHSIYFLPVYLREIGSRYVNNNRGVMPVYQLFSYPFFVAVPAKGCTYDMLYRRILKCLARCVVPPKPGEDWWSDINKQIGKSEDGADDDPFDVAEDDALCCGTSNEYVSSRPNNRPTVQRRLFSLHSINENGSLNLDTLKNSNEPLNLGPRTYIGADWLPKVRARFFDEGKADEVGLHESVHQQTKQHLELRECLKLFMTTEKLGIEDPWYCPTCRCSKQATKKFDLWSLPRVLIVHLKRFSYNRFWHDKLDAFVDFPVSNLRMHDYVINKKHGPAVYDLIAVANHYGGMGGGHYTAYAKNKDTQQWNYFDDSNVSPATEENVVSKWAYVLFYARREDKTSRNPDKSVAQASSTDHRSSLPSASGLGDERMDIV